MKPRLASLLVNGALAALTVLTLFPLLWMLSVSFMPAGAASTLPPPFLPATPTLANYRELLLQAGMLRWLLNSLLLAGAVTAISLA
ncbi:MAG TPA: hypothetical protein VFK15_05565, partial [Burkholderiales bacterium]|nr:hypothetical protein [Burkholderiales bacterium]